MLCSCVKPEMVKQRTDFKISDSSATLYFSILKEIKHLSIIFRAFHEGHFTIPHFVNSKPQVQLKREALIRLLQYSFYVPNSSSEDLGEPHARA